MIQHLHYLFNYTEDIFTMETCFRTIPSFCCDQ